VAEHGPRQVGHGVCPQYIHFEEGSHGPLLRFKRLLEPGRAWPLALVRSRGGHDGHKDDPGGDPTQQSDHGRRQTPTVALRGLAGRSRFHVIPDWLHRSGRSRDRRRRVAAEAGPSAECAIYSYPVWGQGSCRRRMKKKSNC
jgi:hypothetical protein